MRARYHAPVLARILIGAVSGALAGAVGGFVVALVQLQLKRLRNAVLLRRGLPPCRDCVLVPLHLPGMVQGALVGGIVAALASLGTAMLLAGGGLPGLLLVVSTVGVTQQALSRARPPDPPPPSHIDAS